jgi:hypothetical protein
MSSQQGTQTATSKEMISVLRNKILLAEAVVLKDPTEENLANLRSVLDESRKFREALRARAECIKKTEVSTNHVTQTRTRNYL